MERKKKRRELKRKRKVPGNCFSPVILVYPATSRRACGPATASPRTFPCSFCNRCDMCVRTCVRACVRAFLVKIKRPVVATPHDFDRDSYTHNRLRRKFAFNAHSVLYFKVLYFKDCKSAFPGINRTVCKSHLSYRLINSRSIPSELFALIQILILCRHCGFRVERIISFN